MFWFRRIFSFYFCSVFIFSFALDDVSRLLEDLILFLTVDLHGVPLVDVTGENGLGLGSIGTVGTLVRFPVLMNLHVRSQLGSTVGCEGTYCTCKYLLDHKVPVVLVMLLQF